MLAIGCDTQEDKRIESTYVVGNISSLTLPDLDRFNL